MSIADAMLAYLKTQVPALLTGSLADYEYAYYSGLSGLVPANLYSLQDHKLKYFRTFSANPLATLSDAERAFYISKLGLTEETAKNKSNQDLALEYWSSPPVPLADFNDNFARAGVGSLGVSTPSGHPWTTIEGGADIVLGRARFFSVSARTTGFVVVNSNRANAKYTGTLIYSAVKARIWIPFRVLDLNNLLFAEYVKNGIQTGVGLWKLVAGAFTRLDFVAKALGASSSFDIRYDGTLIEVRENGALAITYNVATGMEANTKVGIGILSDAVDPDADDLGSRFDNLLNVAYP